jgi:hypothetical protein
VLCNPPVDVAGESNIKFSLAVLNDVNAIDHRGGKDWLRGLDLNQRPSGYEPDELPGCSTPRSYYVEAGTEIKPKSFTNDDFAEDRLAPEVGFGGFFPCIWCD